MTKPEQAVDLFAKQHNCAQAVLAAFGSDAGLPLESCLRVAAPFGGGIGRLGETCGAIAGAIMVLGLKYGADAAADPRAKAALYERVRDLVARFKSRHGSPLCRQLIDCDLSTPEGLQQAQQRKVHETICPQFVRTAAELLEEMNSPTQSNHCRQSPSAITQHDTRSSDRTAPESR